MPKKFDAGDCMGWADHGVPIAGTEERVYLVSHADAALNDILDWVIDEAQKSSGSAARFEIKEEAKRRWNESAASGEEG